MTFDKAVEVILKHEGGYVNDPVDPEEIIWALAKSISLS